VEEEVTAENVDQDGLSLNSLRAFRVLRPLRAITSIKGLQVLVLSVLAALPLLQDTILVLLSFFLVFSIAGTQLLSGILKKRCINIETGIKYMEGGEEYLCGGRNVCPNDQYFCGKQN
jgi:voltage-dependent calcium channel L type alpha-1D